VIPEVHKEIQELKKQIKSLQSVIYISYIRALAQEELNDELLKFLEGEIEKFDD
jgi:hypothetical protein